MRSAAGLRGGSRTGPRVDGPAAKRISVEVRHAGLPWNGPSVFMRMISSGSPCRKIAVGAALLIACYAILIEPFWIKVEHVAVRNERLAKLFGDEIVVHVSDLHIGFNGTRERMVLKAINAMKPCMTIVSGDLITWKGSVGSALEFLSQLDADLGVWGVLGDYDYSRTRKSCLFCHDDDQGAPSMRKKVHLLQNAAKTLDLPNGKLVIAGVDTSDKRQGNGPLPPALTSADILVAHSPLVFDRIPDAASVLVLAGDTHGGQVALPLWLFRMIGYEKNARYNRGWFEQGAKKMYVGRGIGTSHLPVRLFRRPEITVLHFSR